MNRKWEARGEYGYWVVYEYHPDDSKGVIYDQIRRFSTKRLAEEVAGKLNQAFRYGQEHEAALTAEEQSHW